MLLRLFWMLLLVEVRRGLVLSVEAEVKAPNLLIMVEMAANMAAWSAAEVSIPAILSTHLMGGRERGERRDDGEDRVGVMVRFDG